MTVLGRITKTDLDPEVPGRIERICDWARANNLEPKDVAACVGEVVVAVEEVDGEAVIWYRRFVRSTTGAAQIRTDGGPHGDKDEVWTEEVTAPLVVPMPDRWEP